MSDEPNDPTPDYGGLLDQQPWHVDLPEPPAAPAPAPQPPPSPLRIVEAQVERLEQEIDTMNAELRPLNSFILPGGTPAAAHLHLARTVARRAERDITALAAQAPVNPQAVKYINRLSDHLFVLSRFVNDRGAQDVLWVPGKNR